MIIVLSMRNRGNIFNPLYFSGLAFHSGWGAPVLLLNDLTEARTIPLLINFREAEWIIRELKGDAQCPGIYNDFIALAQDEGYSLENISLYPGKGNPFCQISLVKGRRKKEMLIDGGDAVILSIRSGVDIQMQGIWTHDDLDTHWMGGLEDIWSFSSLLDIPESSFNLWM